MMMGTMGESNWAGNLASLMFLCTMIQQWCPSRISYWLENCFDRFLEYVRPYLQISFHEYTGDRLDRSDVYSAIELYLSANSSNVAKRLKANFVNDSKNFVFSMDDYEEITDTYQGVKLRWETGKIFKNNQTIALYPTDANDRRYFQLTCHRQYRKLVTESYLNYIMEEGKKIKMMNRQRRLYTNTRSDKWDSGFKNSMWNHVEFKHPASFDTLAMDPDKKKEIIDDLMTFKNSKQYYEKVGKAWKRGYLLYGPPGTGKSTMIASMANLMEYDIYDLELTAVANNRELRTLLIETSSKSIIVIEDIDCSLDLTGQRKMAEKDEGGDDDNDDEKDPIKKNIIENEKEDKKDNKVTLSGLLNFIDGLWSCCGEERLIVFTTNHVDKLDPALIRRGRMDKHIELSYCSFEGFKVLAKNYLDIDSHKDFETVEELLEKTQMSPADVADNLMPKSLPSNAEACLENLIKALKQKKEEAELMKNKGEKIMKPEKEEEKVVREALNKKMKESFFWGKLQKRLGRTLASKTIHEVEEEGHK